MVDLGAASFAIVPVFPQFVAKSYQQLGQPVPRMTLSEALRGGFKAVPNTVVSVGVPVIIQRLIEQGMGDSGEKSFRVLLGSSVVAGFLSSPFLACFNGHSMGWSLRKSLSRFTPKQCLAITAQETAFIVGLKATDQLAPLMKQEFGHNKVTEYGTAFIAGVIGSVVGHPANTAVTRWQNDLRVTSFRQSMLGASRRALGVGGFAVCFRIINATLNSKLDG
jgi:hypothetical protein